MRDRREDVAMIVIAPARSDERITLRTDMFGEVLNAVGTESYSRACFELFEQVLDAEHWALFQYRANRSMSCVATASRAYATAAKENCSKFVARCHSVDPSWTALKRQHPSVKCLTKIDIGDIQDRQYRQCFEATRVQERLSFFSRFGSDLYQLSIFRGPRKHTFSPLEMTQFTALAGLILQTAFQHETLYRGATPIPRHLNLETIERLLTFLPGVLSRRERQVCSRAVAGKSIEGTALDLNIRRTSVITYRQRAYQKLGISRHNELVALVHNVRSDNVPDCGSAQGMVS
jgi:DNA-binding CsgD family transcriptional regulator